MKLKTITLVTLLATSSLVASDTLIDQIGVNIGKSYTNNSYNVENNLEETFSAVELYATLNPIMSICKKYDMKPFISYSYSKNSDLKHQYILVGINKYYTPNASKLNLYAGVLGGYGQIDWRYDPLYNSVSKDTTANSFIGGVQLGTTYNLTERFSLNLNAKYLLHNYETNLKTNNENITIEHDRTTSIGLGIAYRF